MTGLQETGALKAEYLLSRYQEVQALDGRTPPRTYLVRRDGTSRLFVRKEVSREAYRIAKQREKLQNPHVAMIEELLEMPDGRCFVFEEYVSGQTLDERLTAACPLPETEATDILLQVLDGLSAIHACGIVHRDVKPENIMISNDGVVKLVDFGIARAENPVKARDTRLLGTEGYAAPEQFGFRQTDARADIYAAGVLLNIMLTGCYPQDRLYEGVRLRKVIERATALDPDRRFESADAMRRALSGAAGVSYRGGSGGPQTAGQRWKAAFIEHPTVPVEERPKIRSGFPGFRSGMLWKKIFGGIAYGVGAFFVFIYVMDAFFLSRTAPFREIVSAVTVFLLCPLLWGNVFYWDHFFSKYLRFPRWLAVALRVILVSVLFYEGMEFYVGVAV